MSSVLETDKSSASDSLPLIQRISYGSLDVAGNLLYCFGSTYILYFYTDVAYCRRYRCPGMGDYY